ncbi:MAG: glutamate--tRNA ligase [Chloroflexota bacterium]|nr:glutamate--tRNA ligase [Chloroflexota bacterium]
MNNKSSKEIRVRFAPSPTGDPHLGAMRTALFNWAFAKKNDGKFILRIEDTDKKRQVEGSVENIIEGLNWLGLNYDEGPEIDGDYGPYTQSQRKNLYINAVNKLIDDGNAYMCDLSTDDLEKMKEEQKLQGKPPGYNGYSRNRPRKELEESKKSGLPIVVRLKVPLSGNIEFTDLKRGTMKFDLSKIDDFVILKADEMPTYHLASVVDDSSMNISHVLRGEEWISSTPKHLLLYKFLGLEPPSFVHLPLIFGKDKAKLSKRHGANSIIEYKKSGLLPEALVNYIALLGWSPRNDKEILTYRDIIDLFDFKGLSVSPSIFDPEKLNWLNGVHIRSLDDKALIEIASEKLSEELKDSADLIDKNKLSKIIPLIKERVKSIDEIYPSIKFFFIYIKPEDNIIKCGSLNKNEIKNNLEELVDNFSALLKKNKTNHKDIEILLRSNCEKLDLKLRDYLGLVRNCITGSEVSPPLFESIEILGLEESISRIQDCINIL